MLYCIPTNGEAGLDDTVCKHFGSAPYFTLYDSDAKAVEVIVNKNAHHEHGTCHPTRQLEPYRLDGVICTGMGARAVAELIASGIRIFRAPGKRVADAVAGITSGSLQELDATAASHDHDHDHSHTG